jgi:hypothetical protein
MWVRFPPGTPDTFSFGLDMLPAARDNDISMAPKITKSHVSPFFKIFGIFCLSIGGMCLLIAVSAARGGHSQGLFYGLAGIAGLFGIGLVISGLLYVGLGEICDHISISANNSRVAAEQLMEANSKLAELIQIQKRGS